MYPKFIITTGGVLRLGMVNQHRHLLEPGEGCLGGGYYEIDYTTNCLVLDRESYDYGRPRWHKIKVLRVPSAYRGMGIIYKSDGVFNVSEELTIEYVD